MIRLLAALSFGAGQNGLPALRKGWYEAEDGFVWAEGVQSSLVLPAPPSSEGVWLELTLGAFVYPPKVRRQKVVVVVNGVRVGERMLGGGIVLRVDVPPHALQNRHQVTVRLNHPNAAIPRVIGASHDHRELSIQLHRLVMLQDTECGALPAPAGARRLLARHRFGWNEATHALLRKGFGNPELDYVWAHGPHSVLRIPWPDPSLRACTLVLDMQPHITPQVGRQRVAIGAGGRLQFYVAMPERRCCAVNLAAPPRGRAFVDVTFENLDAAPAHVDGPGDGVPPRAFMLLGALLFGPEPAGPAVGERRAPLEGAIADGSLLRAVQDLCGQPAQDVACCVESLGGQCEIGTLQRRLGREPASLMRFAGILTPTLIRGLLDGFVGLGRPDTLAVYRREDFNHGYWVVDDVYALAFQTPVSSHKVSEAALKTKLSRTLPFLVRKYFADAVAAEKIFVFQRRDATTRPEAEAVLAALSIWGDVTMLWATYDPAEKPGSVERLGPRLLCGYLDRPAASPPDVPTDETWLSVLANAVAMKAGGSGLRKSGGETRHSKQHLS